MYVTKNLVSNLVLRQGQKFVWVAMDLVDLHELLFYVLDDIVKLLVAGNVDPNTHT